MQFCEKEVPSACTEELPKSIVKVYNVIYPYTFSKDIFSDLKVSFFFLFHMAHLLLLSVLIAIYNSAEIEFVYYFCTFVFGFRGNIVLGGLLKSALTTCTI